MQSIQEDIIVDLILEQSKRIHLIEGLPGCGNVQDFILSINPKEAPLIWLKADSYPTISLVVIDPFLFFNYQPEFNSQDVELLRINNEEDMLIICITNISKVHKKDMTINLISPIVVNWPLNLGKQLILRNKEDYSIEQCLLSNQLEDAA
jgi:flagellar assembly factor FliW